MLKQGLKNALGISIAVTIGMVILPRIMYPAYNQIYPFVFMKVVVQFVIIYIVSFSIYLLLEFLSSLSKKQK